jgi:hypothetical protein
MLPPLGSFVFGFVLEIRIAPKEFPVVKGRVWMEMI